MNLEELAQLSAQALADISQAPGPENLEQLRVKFLGRKSRLSEIMHSLPTLSGEERAATGKQANQFKTAVEQALAQRRHELAAAQSIPALDITLPGTAVPQGRAHPIPKTLEAILSVFRGMGFETLEGPEAEYAYYNFDALNIPPDHPSRESFDTFFIDAAADARHGELLLRSHTSPVQVRAMESRLPPLRVIVPGKVYRPDRLDPSHSFMFHQVEGLMVDDRTTFADLKGVIDQFLKAVFGAQTRIRFRPHFFPFTEPSAEVDIACATCGGNRCATCGRKGWLEIMGCGMVHPRVFKAVRYDPAKVQGFAFGLGVERIAMLKYGVKDIRLFFENDLRFLSQF